MKRRALSVILGVVLSVGIACMALASLTANQSVSANTTTTTLTVTGATTVGTTLGVTGATTLSSTLAAGATTVTTATATSNADKALNVSNGGHISNPIGTGTPPTTGTGVVVAGGTDTAMRVTGASSPVTVTFGTAFAVAPVCVCSNGTTAADGCKTSAEGTGTVVVTTAGTDTFSLICVGK